MTAAASKLSTPAPVGQLGGINLFAYAGNNPITSLDPFGLFRIGVRKDSNWEPIKLHRPRKPSYSRGFGPKFSAPQSYNPFQGSNKPTSGEVWAVRKVADS